jgi:aryl-alcohol dehydrogenase-like predicted oxidoreductase
MSLGTDHDANARLLHAAMDKGINFFDTADLYEKGFNEETVGRAFKEKRHKVIIATKVGNQWRKDGSGWDWNPTKEYILNAVEDSLKRLQTEYIDLYQLHGGTIEDPIDDTIEAFELLKLQGKIRYYGISSIRPNVIREYVKRSKMISVMMQYSLLDRRPEEECLNLLKDNSIGVLARGSLAGGLLVSKRAKEYLTYSSNQVSRAKEAVKIVADDSRTRTETALKFVLNHKAITSAVVGIRNLEQLQLSMAANNSAPLTDEEVKALWKVLEPNRYDSHR